MDTFRSVTEDAFGRMKVSNPYTLFDAHNRYHLSHKFFSTTSNGGTIGYSESESTALLNVSTQSGSYACRESVTVCGYQPGKSLMTMSSFVCAPIQNNLYQRIGYFGTSNGIFLEVSDQPYFVRRSNGTDTKVPQSQWNGGRHVAPPLDLTKIQIFWTDIEWLGAGRVRCGFIIDGLQVTYHSFMHANRLTSVYMTTASLPMRSEIGTTGVINVPATLKSICGCVTSDGGFQVKTNGHTQIRKVPGFGSTHIPTVSIRLMSAHLDAVVVINRIDIVVTTADTVTWELYKGAILTNASFVAVTNLVEADVSATAVNISNATPISRGFVYQKSTITLELDNFNYQLSRSPLADIYTLVLSSDGTNSRASVLLGWNEI